MTERSLNQVLPKVLEKYQFAPLQATYHGITYRSRLEARWAVFFDSLGLAHEYEVEGYNLGDGVLYLPDFWLPKLSSWVEIKGPEPDGPDCEKAHRLATGSGHRVLVFFGGHVMPDDPVMVTSAHAFFPDGTADTGFLWCECPQCGSIGIEYEGRSDRLACKKCLCVSIGKTDCEHGGECPRTSRNGDKARNTDTPKLRAAFAAARTARFGR